MPHIDLLFPNKYLKAADVAEKPDGVTLTIHSVTQEKLRVQGGDDEDKWIIHFTEMQKRPEDKRKRLVLQKTNALLIAKATGKNDSDDWPGCKITLFATTCQAFGATVDCIRVKTAAR